MIGHNVFPVGYLIIKLEFRPRHYNDNTKFERRSLITFILLMRASYLPYLLPTFCNTN